MDLIDENNAAIRASVDESISKGESTVGGFWVARSGIIGDPAVGKGWFV